MMFPIQLTPDSWVFAVFAPTALWAVEVAKGIHYASAWETQPKAGFQVVIKILFIVQPSVLCKIQGWK